MSRDVSPRSKYDKPKRHPSSPCASHLVQFRLLFTKLWHFEQNGTHHFSLIDRHLESVSRTELVFELNLASREKRPTSEYQSEFASFCRVIVLTSQVARLYNLHARKRNMKMANSSVNGLVSAGAAVR